MRPVCLVGAGFIAGVHAEALRAIPSVLLAAVVDPNIEAARRLAAGFGATAHASAEEAPAAALERPLRFHPKRPTSLWAVELGKWVVKRLGGRTARLPSRRDILWPGLTATFDCSDAKQALGWQPVADHVRFVARAIAVHPR
jgi:hypothetical protein